MLARHVFAGVAIAVFFVLYSTILYWWVRDSATRELLFQLHESVRALNLREEQARAWSTERAGLAARTVGSEAQLRECIGEKQRLQEAEMACTGRLSAANARIEERRAEDSKGNTCECGSTNVLRTSNAQENPLSSKVEELQECVSKHEECQFWLSSCEKETDPGQQKQRDRKKEAELLAKIRELEMTVIELEKHHEDKAQASTQAQESGSDAAHSVDGRSGVASPILEGIHQTNDGSGLPGIAIEYVGSDKVNLQNHCRRQVQWHMFSTVLPTMVGPARRKATFALALQVLQDGIPGDFLEAGVAQGGTSILLMLLLSCFEPAPKVNEFGASSEPSRLMWMADNWEGLPQPEHHLDIADPLLEKGKFLRDFHDFQYQVNFWIQLWMSQCFSDTYLPGKAELITGLGWGVYEGMDNFGKWMPINIISKNADGTVVADVKWNWAAGSNATTRWPAVHPPNIRYLDGRSGYPRMIERTITERNYRTLKGLFNETLPKVASTLSERKISFLRCDGDMYSSTYDCLKGAYPYVSGNGFIYVDDYWAFEGPRQAVHDYLTQFHGINPNDVLLTVDEFDDAVLVRNNSGCVANAANQGLDHTFRVHALCTGSTEELMKLDTRRIANAAFWRKPLPDTSK